MFDIHVPLLGWWLVIPGALLICLAVAVFRFGVLSVLASAHAIFAVVVGVFYVASWDTGYYLDLFRSWPGPSRINHTATFSIESRYGGLRMQLQRGATWTESRYWGAPLEFRIVRGTPGKDKFYPLYENDISFFKWDRFEKATRFQLCWMTRPDPPKPLRDLTGVYSITVPHWFIILLCTIFPLLWFRRFRRRRFRLRHGLCLSCGYDLRAHEPGDKCPECGTPRQNSQFQPGTN